MFCINCFNTDTKVTNTRKAKKQPQIWRRRKCPTCSFTFTTYEDVALDELLVVHSEKSKSAFSRGKLLASLLASLGPVGADLSDAYWLLKTVEQKLLAHQQRQSSWQTVTNKLIAELAYETLQAYNGAAGMSYAAGHGLIASHQKRRAGRPKIS